MLVHNIVSVCALVYFQQMWKSAVGHDVSMKVAAEPDDWETDPDFEVIFLHIQFLGVMGSTYNCPTQLPRTTNPHEKNTLTL